MTGAELVIVHDASVGDPEAKARVISAIEDQIGRGAIRGADDTTSHELLYTD